MTRKLTETYTKIIFTLAIVIGMVPSTFSYARNSTKSPKESKNEKLNNAELDNKNQNKKINIDEYLDHVKKVNPAFKATAEASQGAKLRSTEGTLLILPQLSIEASKAVDESQPTNVNAEGTKKSLNAYSVSLLQNTTFGLSGKLSYGNDHFVTSGASLTFVPTPDYYRASPSIELTQSLWKNGFGSEVRAQKKALNSSAQAVHYAERAKNLGVIIEAQNAYYKLYYTQKTVDAFKESMEVAKKLQSWAKKKLNQGLGEKSDYYQAKAAYELRELEYLNALQNKKTAAREFNSLRGENSDVVLEELSYPPQLKYVEKSFSEKIWRDDVRAADKASEAAKAYSILGKERNKPTLDIFGSYAWNGMDVYYSEAQEESFDDNYPSYMIGVKFVAPLAVGKAHDVIKGYQKEAIAADLAFKRKVQEQQRDYYNLIAQIENADARLKLASTLEESQRIKVQSERKRHGRGRTTFFQVLQFEQDYLTSQLNKIKTQAELSALLTQLQRYREE